MLKFDRIPVLGLIIVLAAAEHCAAQPGGWGGDRGSWGGDRGSSLVATGEAGGAIAAARGAAFRAGLFRRRFPRQPVRRSARHGAKSGHEQQQHPRARRNAKQLRPVRAANGRAGRIKYEPSTPRRSSGGGRRAIARRFAEQQLA